MCIVFVKRAQKRSIAAGKYHNNFQVGFYTPKIKSTEYLKSVQILPTYFKTNFVLCCIVHLLGGWCIFEQTSVARGKIQISNG